MCIVPFFSAAGKTEIKTFFYGRKSKLTSTYTYQPNSVIQLSYLVEKNIYIRDY